MRSKRSKAWHRRKAAGDAAARLTPKPHKWFVFENTGKVEFQLIKPSSGKAMVGLHFEHFRKETKPLAAPSGNCKNTSKPSNPRRGS